jgi:hypothetical protein
LITNPLDIQPLLLFSLNHAFQHAVHVSHCWSEDIDAGSGHELSSFRAP